MDIFERRQLDARGITVVSGEVAGLVVDEDRLTGVELTDGRIVALTAVFVRPGIHPHPDGLLVGLGCHYEDTGFVTTDSTGRTSNLGVIAIVALVALVAAGLVCRALTAHPDPLHQPPRRLVRGEAISGHTAQPEVLEADAQQLLHCLGCVTLATPR